MERILDKEQQKQQVFSNIFKVSKNLTINHLKKKEECKQMPTKD
jgi:hypothetical protein